MHKTFDRSSFVYGMIAATILACFVGAAANNDVSGPKYDAVNVMGGLGLQIVDHGRHKLYHYRRIESGEATTYRLVETVNLAHAGKVEIKPVPTAAKKGD